MPQKNILKSLAALLLLLTVCSCGAGETGGGVGEFKTVYVSQPQLTSANPLLSDIAIWTDTDISGNIEPCVDTYRVQDQLADFGDITVQSTSYLTSKTPSDVTITTGSVLFAPADTLTLALPPLFASQPFTVNRTIPPGGSISISPLLVSRDMKSYLQSGGLLGCTTSTYSYWVTIALDVVENSTNMRQTLRTQMKVNFADY